MCVRYVGGTLSLSVRFSLSFGFIFGLNRCKTTNHRQEQPNIPLSSLTSQKSFVRCLDSLFFVHEYSVFVVSPHSPLLHRWMRMWVILNCSSRLQFRLSVTALMSSCSPVPNCNHMQSGRKALRNGQTHTHTYNGFTAAHATHESLAMNINDAQCNVHFRQERGWKKFVRNRFMLAVATVLFTINVLKSTAFQ